METHQANTIVYGNKNEKYRNFAAKATIFGFIYLIINIMYHQGYLSQLGFDIGFFSIAKTLPLKDNFIVALYALLIWAIIIEMPFSTYRHFMDFFDVSLWGSRKTVFHRVLAIISMLSLILTSRIIFTIYKSFTSKTNIFFTCIIFLNIIIVFISYHYSTYSFYLIKNSYKKNPINLITVINFVLLLLTQVVCLISIIMSFRFIEFVSLVNEILFSFQINYLSDNSTLLFFSFPVIIFLVVFMYYRYVRSKGIKQLDKKYFLEIAYDTIFPSLLILVMFFSLIIFPTFLGSNTAEINIKNCITKEEHLINHFVSKYPIYCQGFSSRIIVNVANQSKEQNSIPLWELVPMEDFRIHYYGKFYEDNVFISLNVEENTDIIKNYSTCVIPDDLLISYQINQK